MTALGEPAALEKDLRRWGADETVRIVSPGTSPEPLVSDCVSEHYRSVRIVSPGTSPEPRPNKVNDAAENPADAQAGNPSPKPRPL